MPVYLRRAEYLDTYAIGQLLSLSFYPWGQWARPLMDLLVALDVQSRFNEPDSQYVCLIASTGSRVVGSLEIPSVTSRSGACPIYLI